MVRHRRVQRRQDLEEYLQYLLDCDLCRRAWGLPTPEGHDGRVREVKQALAALGAERTEEQLALFDV